MVVGCSWYRNCLGIGGMREEANKVTPLPAAATKSLIATDSGFTIASATAKACLIEPTKASRYWEPTAGDLACARSAALRRRRCAGPAEKNREGEDDNGCVRGASCGRASLPDDLVTELLLCGCWRGRSLGSAASICRSWKQELI
jgi:hypothetical protein